MRWSVEAERCTAVMGWRSAVTVMGSWVIEEARKAERDRERIDSQRW